MLGINLQLMGAETRARRSTIESLESFAGRLGPDGAALFNTMLRQSPDLGSDIGQALGIALEPTSPFVVAFFPALLTLGLRSRRQRGYRRIDRSPGPA